MIRFLLFFSLFTSSLHAGNLVVMKSESGGDDYVMQMEPKRIRIDLTDSKSGEKKSILFFSEFEMAQMVDHGKKSYVEMNKEDMEKMAQSMSSAFKMMEAQMAKLPPKVRKMMKEKMGGMQMPTKEDFKPLSLKKIKSGVKVGDHKTDHQKVMRGQKTVSEFWTVPLSKLKLDKKSYDILFKMSGFFNKMTESMGNRGGEMAGGFEAWKKIKGLPVKVINYSKKGQKTMVLEKAVVKSFPDSLFQVPKGYSAQSVQVQGMPGAPGSMKFK